MEWYIQRLTRMCVVILSFSHLFKPAKEIELYLFRYDTMTEDYFPSSENQCIINRRVPLKGLPPVKFEI